MQTVTVLDIKQGGWRWCPGPGKARGEAWQLTFKESCLLIL